MNDIATIQETLRQHDMSAAARRQVAGQVASAFEQIFVQQMVEGFRKAALNGEEGGMFGTGPGSDTYAQWFDQHMSRHLSENGDVGIRRMLMRQFESLGEITPANGSASEVNHVL